MRDVILPFHLSFCLVIVMTGSTYGSPEAGLNMTSGFLMLVVRPKLAQAIVEKTPPVIACREGLAQVEHRRLRPGAHLGACADRSVEGDGRGRNAPIVHFFEELEGALGLVAV